MSTPKQYTLFPEMTHRDASGYCSRCNVTSRDIARHRTGEEHLRAMSGIRISPGGAAAYSPRRAAAAAAYASVRRWDEQYDV